MNKATRYCPSCGNWLPKDRKDKYCPGCRLDIEEKVAALAESQAGKEETNVRSM